MSCCIGITERRPNNVSFQRALHLIHATSIHDASPHEPETDDNRAPFVPPPCVAISWATALEDAICARLAWGGTAATADRGGKKEESLNDPVQIFVSEDSHLLRCRPLLSNTTRDNNGQGPAPPTIFGIRESAASLAGKLHASGVVNGNISTHLSLLEPQCDSIFNSSFDERQDSIDFCCCEHPRGTWQRQKKSSKRCKIPYPQDAVEINRQILFPCTASVKIIDLTKIQNLRRERKITESYPCFDTPGKVFHLLRSLLNCKCGHKNRSVSPTIGTHHSGLHCASPWKWGYHDEDISHSNNFGDSASLSNDDNKPNLACAIDPVVALLVKDPASLKKNENTRDSNDKFWDHLEEQELRELLKFRTGDAAPSYFLYSSFPLAGSMQSNNDIANPNESSGGDEKGLDMRKVIGKLSEGKMLVYRHLPPRDMFSCSHPDHEVCDCSAHCNGNRHFLGCLWETFLENPPETGLNFCLGQATNSQPVVRHRIVAPPYQSYTEEYPGLLDSLLKRINDIREEALRIPHWTAWPERNHYASSMDDVENEGGGDNNEIYPASWTVFPLCHTFPANDISQRKFIERTCSFVPKTTALLQEVGPTLRTALFSRLGPLTTLGTHTGWSDLANHVLRIHIPLIVPNQNNSGLCGTWVDGCVETHDEGRVICFDDSKVHRAFNYSEEERIVLIVDLERNCSGPLQLPVGTATGGHTDELDSFIKELT